MSDTIVKLETAKLAKEKGFDDACKITYNKNKELLTGWTKDMYNAEFKTSCVAPTQTSLQKWLREIHEIDVFAYSVRFTGYLEIGFYTYSVKGITPTMNYRFDIFEDALEAGLIEGLNQLP